MISDKLGISHIETLYLQLLYRCNFNCGHCFHGEKLKDPSLVDLESAVAIIDHFRSDYSTGHVVLLGGEPFLHPDLGDVLGHAHAVGLTTEVCTNGHRFTHAKIRSMGDSLTRLRVSIDGLEQSHDRLRRTGAFRHAIAAVAVSADLGIDTGVTTTVTSENILEIPELAEAAAMAGATTMKLHQLRLVGNAANSPHLLCENSDLLEQLVVWARSTDTISVMFDDDLDPSVREREREIAEHRLDRIEMDPEYGLTMSCKAVGRGAQAFHWDPKLEQIEYRPTVNDEIAIGIPDVHYV